jgi:hypothetical protein
MTYIFYTFRPQICDQQLFEDFLTLFVPFVTSHKEYAYSVESDGTLSKHLHVIVGSPPSGVDYKDLDKFYQRFNKANGLREFKEFAKKHANTSEVAFKPMKVKDTKEDLLHCLGYTMKEHATRQETNFPNQQVLDAVEYYFAHQRIKAKDNTSKDWTILTGKNVNVIMERYIQDNEIKLPDPLLGNKMSADRFCKHNCSEKQFRQAQAEIHLALAKEAGVDPDYDEKEIVFSYSNNTKDSFLFEDYYHNQEKDKLEILNLKGELSKARAEIEKLKKQLSQVNDPLQVVYKS